MAVTSLEFFGLLAATLVLLALVPGGRKWVLIGASLIFYANAGIASLAIIGVLIACNYGLLRIILHARSERIADRAYFVSMLFNAAIFFTFKLIFEPAPGLPANGWHTLGVTIGYPLGLSFVILMLHSALTDAHSGKYRPNGKFGTFLLFGTFFPYITSGPIERLHHMEPQLNSPARPGLADLAEGIPLIALGVAKKFVVANRLQLYVGNVFSNDAIYSSPTLAFAMALNAMHIYCDFSAYTDIVRGAARCMGIRIEINFNRPFRSHSVTEFWRRWHISFSNWLRDYLYMPLAFALRRRGQAGNAAALLLTFTLCGFWHNAAWTYVLFGLLHGLAMIGEMRFAPRLSSGVGLTPLRSFAARLYLYVFLALTMALFSAANLNEAADLFRRLFTDTPVPRPAEFLAYRGPVLFALMVAAVVGWQLLEAWHRRLTPASRPWFLLVAAWATLFGSTLGEGFIYAQF